MDPTSRLAQHLSPSNLTPGSNGSRKKKMWITESLAAGREIELVVLAKLDISICYAVEQAIIRGLHRAGYPILNQTKYETIKGIIQ